MKKPKILFLDIETCPILAYVWRTGPMHYLSNDNIKQGQKIDIICAAYKWDDNPKVYSISWNVKHNSRALLLRLKSVIEKADLVVAHSGDSFDVKHINSQCLLHNIPPIAWPETFDTLKQARRAFYLASFKLDYLGKTLLNDKKHTMGFSDWIDVVENKNKKSLEKMIRYCKKDVRLLARVYHKIKPYLKAKSNMALINKNRWGCPICGSKDSRSKGVRYLRANIYQRRICNHCGHVFSGPRIVG